MDLFVKGLRNPRAIIGKKRRKGGGAGKRTRERVWEDVGVEKK
jgi:hypothetical protein